MKPFFRQGSAPGSPVDLWLIRHAEVEQRYHGVFGGQIDMDLSPRGHEQAATLAQYVRLRRFHAIYASPMKRVQQTLAPCLANGMPRPTVLPGLVEVGFGDWTGLTFGEVHARFGVHAFQWLDQLESAAIPNAESAENFRARVESCLREIIQGHTTGQIAVVCHGGVIRMLLAILLGWRLSQMTAFEIDYASLTQVTLRPHRAYIQLLNFSPWRQE